MTHDIFASTAAALAICAVLAGSTAPATAPVPPVGPTPPTALADLPLANLFTFYIPQIGEVGGNGSWLPFTTTFPGGGGGFAITGITFSEYSGQSVKIDIYVGVTHVWRGDVFFGSGLAGSHLSLNPAIVVRPGQSLTIGTTSLTDRVRASVTGYVLSLANLGM